MSNIGAKAVQQRIAMTVDPKSIKPLGVMVLIERLPNGRTEGGIVVPDSVKLRNRAKVHAVGPGTLEGGVRTPIGVKPGDCVILAPQAVGMLVGKVASGNELLLTEESNLLAVDVGDYDSTVRFEAVQ
jgi:co-chaperonin GroES (HSP10)